MSVKDKLIVLSGGMDSVTLLHLEKKNIKKAVSFYYGQKHSKELYYAQRNCDKLDIPWLTVDIQAVIPTFKSALLKGGEEIPEGHYEDETMKKTVVPFRNGIMLSIAAGIAECNDYGKILIANHAGDHAIYPDCRVEFIAAMSLAINRGTYKDIQIETPFSSLKKRDIALIGKGYKVDYKDTWSCYKGGELHCGKCGTCVERREALNGFDPTEYI